MTPKGYANTLSDGVKLFSKLMKYLGYSDLGTLATLIYSDFKQLSAAQDILGGYGTAWTKMAGYYMAVMGQLLLTMTDFIDPGQEDWWGASWGSGL